ncbi:hypothetical protein CRI94_07265 [Longibacter salinarum]|uniref:Uncharacterized protein n=2 Tax=Longibacter salinarum TaxID=1850348 RepID=A0A2A8CZ21_9BACT|nr:hypothetical protein CRI94_07265 [Longibacter salinarum]
MGRSAARRALAAMVLLALMTWTTGCGNSGQQGVSASRLDVSNTRLVTITETGERSFSGTLINENSKAVSIVQVDVALYDETGARVGTTMIEVEDVPANSEKDFSGALDVDYPVAKARVLSVATP